ncbi:hypothetical protein BCR32DRAFT_324996 [Anaeromyces robustus]|uniref:MATH domain-containing protein n=1 Tax=Anaeromyces robustus TaxID=1754192 RepID=A0A1Y1XKP5_9FUNG|nr:hypothetical protein BCR32DRAFT_324996 [Anaeromyces robustus]|eukprot:ORX86330.1 hypothetical protein BCR32DRAFT_324996 [Anaeromyces robustus]
MDKTEFINELKENFYGESIKNYEIVKDGIYEWKIENWEETGSRLMVHSKEFHMCGYRWNLHLNPVGSLTTNFKYVSLFLDRLNPSEDYSVHIPMNIVFFIRSYNDYSSYKSATLPTVYYSKDHNGWGHTLLIRKSDLNEIIRNNKCVFGIYYHVYKYKKELYKNEIINSLYSETEECVIKSDNFYEWEIKNWSGLPSCAKSPVFNLGKLKWQLLIKPNPQISLFIYLVNPPYKRTRVKVSLFIRNYKDPECFVYKNLSKYTYFTVDDDNWGKNDFIDKTELFDKNEKLNKSIIEDNRVIIGVYLQIMGDEKEYPCEDMTYISKIFHSIKLDNDEAKKIKNEERKKIEQELRTKIEQELRTKIENENRYKTMNYPYSQYPSYYPPSSVYYPHNQSLPPPPPTLINQNQNPATPYYPSQPPPPQSQPSTTNPAQNPPSYYYLPPPPPATATANSTQTLPPAYYPPPPNQNPSSPPPTSPNQTPAPTYYPPPPSKSSSLPPPSSTNPNQAPPPAYYPSPNQSLSLPPPTTPTQTPIPSTYYPSPNQSLSLPPPTSPTQNPVPSYYPPPNSNPSQITSPPLSPSLNQTNTTAVPNYYYPPTPSNPSSPPSSNTKINPVNSTPSAPSVN